MRQYHKGIKISKVDEYIIRVNGQGNHKYYCNELHEVNGKKYYVVDDNNFRKFISYTDFKPLSKLRSDGMNDAISD